MIEREGFLPPEIGKIIEDAISDVTNFASEAEDFWDGRMDFPQTWWVSRREILGEILYIWKIDPKLIHQALKEILNFGNLNDLYPQMMSGLKTVLLYPLDPTERKPKHHFLARLHEIETRYSWAGIPGVYSVAHARIALEAELEKRGGYFGHFVSIYNFARQVARP